MSLGYGYSRLEGSVTAISTSQPFQVGIVQANVAPESTRGNPQRALDAIGRHMQGTWVLRDRGADLVVWPETAVPVAFPVERIAELYPPFFSRELGVPALIGAALLANPNGFYNGAVAIGADGGVEGTYLKRRLAPFGEWIPGRESIDALSDLFPEAQVLPGPRESEALRALGHPVSMLICFEALFPDLVRSSIAADRSELLVALVNDGWFGDTWEPHMHFAETKLRAVESGRYLVRAASSGNTAVVDPWGRAQGATEAGVAADIMEGVAFSSMATPYARLGNKPWWIAAMAFLYVVLKRRRGPTLDCAPRYMR
jgi:apolipoprotein N-acyltransferase